MKKLGFTLLELIIVVIIIGILATLAIVSYRGMRESALDQEAIANLKLIQAAEEIYRMEDEDQNYYTTGGGSQACMNDIINGNLSLSLPICTSNPAFNYRILASGGFSAYAERSVTGTYHRVWILNPGEDEPVCQPGGWCK